VENAVYLLKLVVRWATLTVSISLLLLVAAGTTRLPSLRNYLVTFSAFLLATMLAIDPELAKERCRAFETGGTTGRFVAGLCFLATLALSALDVARLHWFHSVPAEARLGSLLLVAASSVLQMWAMVVNPFQYSFHRHSRAHFVIPSNNPFPGYLLGRPGDRHRPPEGPSKAR